MIGVVGVEGRFVAGLAQGAVVDEGSYGDAVDELGNAAGVVDVVVGEQDIVEVVQSGIFGGGNDTVGIASCVAGPAGVDEERVMVRGDEEGGLAAFYVDDEDFEVAGRVLGAEGGAREEGDEDEDGRLHEGSGVGIPDRDIIDRWFGDGTGSREEKTTADPSTRP